ncbi:MAG: LysR family transcriptional regulator [Pseudomonadota bacterium]
MAKKSVPPVFSEMLRSFTTLARSLNLSQTVDELKLTRQTVRRHINELEQRLDTKLFILKNRQYQLTETGADALAGAERLLVESETWLSSGRAFPKGLTHASEDIDDTSWMYSQQHPLNAVWKSGAPMLREGLRLWTQSKASLSHNELSIIRPYCMIYRPYNGDWLCVEVGDQSSYASWFGRDMAQNTLGRHLSENKTYSAIYDYLVHAYEVVINQGGLWYDHVSASVPRHPDQPPQSVHYQRLVAAFAFPDGEPAAMVLISRTNNIDIPSMPPERFSPLADNDVMKFAA